MYARVNNIEIFTKYFEKLWYALASIHKHFYLHIHTCYVAACIQLRG